MKTKPPKKTSNYQLHYISQITLAIPQFIAQYYGMAAES